MPPTSSMQRLWLAALFLLAVVVRGGAADIFSRTEVAHGGRVDMQLVQGKGHEYYYQYSYRTYTSPVIDWVFYREPASTIDSDEETLAEYLSGGDGARGGYVKHDDSKVCLFLPQGADCVVVTLYLNPGTLIVREDRFVGTRGFGHMAFLNGVDELELHAPYEWPGQFKRLQRDPNGTWLLAGQPGKTPVKSQIHAVPLPPLPKKPGQKQRPAGVMSRDVPKALYHAACYRLLPTDIGQLSSELVMAYFRPDYEHEFEGFAKQRRLECIRAFASAFKTSHTLMPVLEAGPDMEMPSILLADDPNGKDLRGWRTDAEAKRLFQHDPWYNRGWITAAELNRLCFTTDYHKLVSQIIRSYGGWKQRHDMRLLKSLHGEDDLAFLFVGEWIIERAGR